MRRFMILIGIVTALSAVGWEAVESQPLQPQPPADTSAATADKPSPDRSMDQAAIQANIVAFEEAYNAKDAKAVAGLFTADAVAIDKSGHRTEGRERIAEVFQDVFAAAPGSKIEVYIDSLQFLGGDLAVEVGTTVETREADEPPLYDGYTVLHVKRDGQWHMALARDEEGPPPTHHERLQPLAWLVGEWVDDDGSSVVASTCRWSDDGNFLLQEFQLQLHGEEAMNVSQRIGWDPLANCIRAWVFDSEGGFAQSVWSREDEGWLIRSEGVRPDGTTAAATNRLLSMGDDAYLYESSDRVIGGEPQPAVQVKVVRKPPEPAR